MSPIIVCDSGISDIHFISNLSADGFDDQPSHLPQSPAGRAAGIARAALIFRQKLKLGLIRPEATKEGPICMDTYR